MRIYRCPACQNEFAAIEKTFTRCPHCESRSFILVKVIDSVKIMPQTEPHTA